MTRAAARLHRKDTTNLPLCLPHAYIHFSNPFPTIKTSKECLPKPPLLYSFLGYLACRPPNPVGADGQVRTRQPTCLSCGPMPDKSLHHHN
ncbi:hypothetical protein XENTR_v10024210 [Xenopus tropicalis]|nr:hypothetical protein XENTR_v10024210 [Xenopus tropicalis]